MHKKPEDGARTEWKLFIDESGDFDEHDDTVVVAGLLTRASAVGPTLAELTRGLKLDLGDAPYPPHTSSLHHPLSAVVEHAAATSGHDVSWQPARHPEAVVLEDAAKVIRESPNGGAFEEAVNGLVGGKRLVFGALGRFRDVLSTSAPALLERLTWQATLRAARLRARLQTLPRSGENAVVVASEDRRGASMDAVPDRYLHLLGRLLERTADVLLHLGGEHIVDVVVYGRYVPGVGVTARRVPLAVPRVAAAIGRIGGPVLERGAGREVRLVASDVQSDSARTDARLVLADFISNRARQCVLRPHPIAFVESCLRIEVGINPRSGTPAASHLAASGRPALAVSGYKATRNAADAMAMLAPLPVASWPRDQAEEWLRALG